MDFSPAVTMFLIDGFLKSQVPLDKQIRLKGEQSSNLGTIFGTRDYHKCDHCLGDSSGILCKLDNKVVNQLVWYTPWSRCPFISPVLHKLKLPLPDGPTWAGGWISRVLRWLLSKSLLPVTESWLKSCKVLPSQFRICTPQGFLFGLGCFCCFLFGVWFGFFRLLEGLVLSCIACLFFQYNWS